MAVRDPRKKIHASVATLEDTSDASYKTSTRKSRKNNRLEVGNRISTNGRMRSRKKILRSRPRHRADEFVPKLLKVMNISYKDAHSFRVPETGGNGEISETIIKDPPYK